MLTSASLQNHTQASSLATVKCHVLSTSKPQVCKPHMSCEISCDSCHKAPVPHSQPSCLDRWHEFGTLQYFFATRSTTNLFIHVTRMTSFALSRIAPGFPKTRGLYYTTPSRRALPYWDTQKRTSNLWKQQFLTVCHLPENQIPSGSVPKSDVQHAAEMYE